MEWQLSNYVRITFRNINTNYKFIILSLVLQSISPGMVKTEILIASGYDLIPPGMTIDQAYDTIPHLKCEDICDAITYALGTPPHVQVQLITSYLVSLY